MIDTKVIRNKILDLAVHGKLTEQLSEDGTAEELFRQIQAEKQTLIKAGKIKKEKPLPEINENEIPFEIPRNWKWVRLGAYLDVRDGTHDTPKYVSVGYPLVTSKNLQNGVVSLDDVKYISKVDYDAINERSQVNEGDILFAMIGSIGNPAIVSNNHAYAIKNVALFKRILPANEKYVLYFFSLAQYDMQKKAIGGLQPFVSLGYLRNYLIPIPPLAEQKRIVEKVEQAFSVLDIIDELQKKYADNMTVLKSKLIDLAIRGKLTEQLPEDGTAKELYQQIQTEKQALIKAGKIKKEKPLPEINESEIPFEIPNNWKWVRWGDLLRVISGISYDKSDVTTIGMRILRGGNIQNGKVVFDDSDVFLTLQYKDNEKTIKQGDVIIVASTGSEAVIGKPGYVETDNSNTMIGAFLRICRSFLLDIAQYNRIVFTSDYYRQAIRQKAKGTNINNVKENYITHLLVPLPPLAEQKRIVERLDKLLAVCDELK